MDFGALVLVIVGIVAVATVTSVVLTVASPMRNSWIRRLSRRAALESAGVEAELERMRERIVELEERLEFTERLLTQQREAQRLAGGG
jgi:hypothetical protein